MRLLFCLAITLAVAGCGGSNADTSAGMSPDSFTAKAFDEYRAGKGHDAKGKPPSAAEIAKTRKRIKIVESRSKKDLLQGLRILSNQRDHDDLHFNTFASSYYLSEAYKRAFGPLEAVNSKDQPNTWSITCSDGKMTFRGTLKVPDDPTAMFVRPPSPK